MAYEKVNGQWPDIVPALTGDEAIAAAKRLYRFTMKKSWKGKWALTSGRRYTWPRGGTFYVNPDRGDGLHGGWRDLIHMMSHYCHRQLHPNHKPHDGRHHFLEKEMVAYVLQQRWLTGKLRKAEGPKPSVAQVIGAEQERLAAQLKRWETKRKRADTAIRKLRQKAARLERRLAA